MPNQEVVWNVAAVLFAALIAAVAAIYAAERAASTTMKNARELQDRERRREEQSVAALLSADLHKKLILLVLLLQEPPAAQVEQLATMDTSNRVFEAALPKLGALGHRGGPYRLDSWIDIVKWNLLRHIPVKMRGGRR